MTTHPLHDPGDEPSGILRRVAFLLRRRLAQTPSRFGVPQSVALAVAIVPIFLWLGRDLPRVPWLGSDSASYLAFSTVRPHGYSMFLAAYQLVFEDLAHLPRVQLALYLGAVLLLATAVGRRTRSFTAATATLLLVGVSTDASVFPWISSDPLYAAALTAGAACLILHLENRRAPFLLLASAGLASAFLIRPIGLALLPGFVIAVVVHAGWDRRRLMQAAVLTALPMVFLCCSAASSQLIHNARFTLGNWGGMDVLGKVPLLSGRLPEAFPLARLNSIVDELQPARDKLRLANNPFLEALIAGQYYEYLRWFVIVHELERTWPSWRDGDEYHRGQLAASLAISYVAANPIGFLRRTAVDLVGLWTMPRWLTEGEQSAAIKAIERIGELPLLLYRGQCQASP